MRQRLVVAFVGLATVVVALYGIPRAFVVRDMIHSQEQHRVDDTAALVAHILDERTAPLSSAALDAINRDHEWIVVRHGSESIGTTGSAGGGGRDDLRATRELSQGGTVTVGLSEPVVSSAVNDALVPLAVLGLAIIVLAGALGFLMARRFAQPLQELADAASGLGEGNLHPDLPTYRILELREIGKALTDSGAQIENMLAHERRLAVHASHELRTPVAALRLELEDVALWPETAPSVAAQLRQATGELDRLSSAIGDLLNLTRARRGQAETEVDLEVLVDDALRRLDDDHHRVVHERRGRLPVRLDPVLGTEVISEVIRAVLTVATSAVVSSRDKDTHVEVRAAPDGRVPSAPEATLETSQLAAALGAQISRDDNTLVLRLPKHLDP